MRRLMVALTALFLGCTLSGCGGSSSSATPATLQSGAPPTFAGVTSATATSPTAIDVAWSPATDNVTPASAMTYLIYVANAQGGQNFSTPSFTTSPGATTYTLQGLTPGATYYVVVRASNGQGMTDSNVIEKSATTATSSDASVPTFVGIASVARDSAAAGTVQLSWSAASDNLTPASQIVYLIYMSGTPGGEHFNAPSYTTSPGATSYAVSGLTSGAYYFVVRSRDAAGNMDTNSVEMSATVGSISATAGNPQSAALNTPFAVPLTVTVSDGATLPSGVAVTFWVPGTGAGAVFQLPDGSTSSTATVTTVNGIATAPPLIANATAGSYTAVASTGSSSTEFSLTNFAIGAIVVANGVNDAAAGGAVFPQPMQARVSDPAGTALANIAVTFTAPPGGATGTFAGGLSSVTVLTDGNGVATAPAFTAGGTSGSYYVTATAGTLSAAFTRTNF